MPSHDRRLMYVSILAAGLAVGACATHEDIRSLTYDWTGEHRVGAERSATQKMQDSCYLSGYQYFRTEGPPQIVSEAGPQGRHFQATQSFTCVGTTGGV
jgi:hypothetical protein